MTAFIIRRFSFNASRKKSMSDNLIIETSLDSFEDDVLTASHQKPILVDFWAEWCPPCVVVAPLLEQVVRERDGEVLLVKLEVDEGENMKLAGRYQVRGFPTIILFEHGEEKGRFSGAKPASHIEQFIDDHSELI
jgi:putative thioredoxin